MDNKITEALNKDGRSICKAGYFVGSDTGFKKCPKCKIENEKDRGCISSMACANALRGLSKMFK